MKRAGNILAALSLVLVAGRATAAEPPAVSVGQLAGSTLIKRRRIIWA